MGLLDLIAGPVKGLVDSILGGVDALTTTEEEKLTLKAEIRAAENAALLALAGTEAKIIEQQSKTIRAEATGHSWLQRNWRPLTALAFVFIVVNNYVLVPYAMAFGAPVPVLDIPPGMWALLTTMIGGYTVGRSLEKYRTIKNE